MSRELSTDIQTATAAEQVRPFYLFEGEFTTGNAYLWTGIGDFVWDSKTWLGYGSLLGIPSIEETAEVRAAGIEIALNSIPSAFVSLVLSGVRQGYFGRVYIGFMDESNELIDDPYMIFDGRLDTTVIEETGETSNISLNYESRLIDLQKNKEIRYTHEEQLRLYAGDMGLEFVADMQDKTITWGKK